MVETKNYAVAIGGSNIDILATPKNKIISKDSNNCRNFFITGWRSKKYI